MQGPPGSPRKMQRPLRFFLSSTATDLGEARAEMIRFLGIIPSDLFAMEFFGSDEAQPKDFCLRQVSRSNFFIGVYAQRYGTIDKDTGLSITELEYDKARLMFELGQMTALLFYIIDQEAEWPIKYFDKDHERITKLDAFKDKLKRDHVITLFKTTKDLPFLILKDVIKKNRIGRETI